MSLPYQQQRRLRRIDRALRRSDPHLAAMLRIFTRICADEEFPGWEQLRTASMIWSLLIWPVAAGSWLAAATWRAVCCFARLVKRAGVTAIAAARRSHRRRIAALRPEPSRAKPRRD